VPKSTIKRQTFPDYYASCQLIFLPCVCLASIYVSTAAKSYLLNYMWTAANFIIEGRRLCTVGLGGQNTFLGQQFLFHFMFRIFSGTTKFGESQKTFGGHCPRNPPQWLRAWLKVHLRLLGPYGDLHVRSLCFTL